VDTPDLPAHVAAPEPLRTVIGQLIRFVKATYTLNRSAARRDVGLPAQQVQAAMHLALSGGLTVGELAAELGVSAGWASRLADELVLAGNAIREQDPTDRRVVRLRISPAMQAHCSQIYCDRSAAVARAFEGASPEDLATFTRLLSRLAAEFETLASRETAEPAPATAVVDEAGASAAP
jgi:DNA-binding MarR family transcriptional regulator